MRARQDTTILGMKVVVVGGAGAVGSLVVPVVADRHDVVLADLEHPDWWEGEFALADVTRPATLEGIFDGADALVYMAMGPMSDWGAPGWAQQHFAVSVGGAHAASQAAGNAGVHRMVLASSASVFQDFDDRPDATEADATEPYGLSKTCGEVVLRAASRQFGIPVVALRMILPRADEEFLAGGFEFAHLATSASDTAAAYVAALERDIEPGFHAVTLSGNPGWGDERQLRLKEVLGWEPKVLRPEVG